MSQETAAVPDVYDVLIMGAGFGGLHAVHRLREDGLKVRAFDTASDTGGAWYWNSYPGARCDVESLVYSYSFSPIIEAEWRWSERYAGREEICRYLQWVATRLDLRKDISFNTRVVSARFDKTDDLWHLVMENGDEFLGRHFLSAPGPISHPIMPDIPGLDDFAGLTIHTARWPKEEPDLADKRVGVIGTGSSGTQLIPLVAEKCAHLDVFMRTRNYYSPARNRPLTDDDYAWWRENADEVRTLISRSLMSGAGDIMLDRKYTDIAALTKGADLTPEQREEVLEARWAYGGGMVGYAFRDVLVDPQVNEQVGDFFRRKLHTFIDDQELATKLEPHGFPVGTKRPTVGTGFVEALARPNVTLVDVKELPIERITAKGVVVNGKEYELDVLILASGFDALTGALTVIDVRGEEDASLKELWDDSIESYLGITVAGFPNFYMIGGPLSPSVLSNVVATNEFQVDWIADLIGEARRQGKTLVKTTDHAQKSWRDKVEKAATNNEWSKTDSWYVGTNVPGKRKQILTYTGGIGRYRRYCDEERSNGFASFKFE